MRHASEIILVNKAIDDAKKGKLPTVVGIGDTKRNYIYVRDVAQAIVKCFEERITGIHYLGGEEKTIKSMLNDICEVFDLGSKPLIIKGQNSTDQVIENSNHFKITPFKTALEQMI